ncbi:MAG: 16S rRNA (uracil(1498)-N(3))-methyltransferase [Chloroflexi bacterium]|nr:MAG: 16S rRNA (uracil(1498)-N(3))-methyltransferase [Chloroflexota bacterium]
MHRFFVEATLLTPSLATILLPDKLAHQVRDVLRLVVGEQLILLDNSGDEILCAVTKTGRAGVEVQILERRTDKGEPSTRIVLCQGLLKTARFEWILEKGTELGVTTFAPTLCRRSMSGLEDAGPAKIQRWQRIVQEAAEQCGRARIPTLLPIRSFPQAIDAIPDSALALIPWEEERDLSLRTALADAVPNSQQAEPLTVVVFIGPEGGFAAEEIALARQRNVQVVTLGQRVMRAETAALVAVANVLYTLEMGS